MKWIFNPSSAKVQYWESWQMEKAQNSKTKPNTLAGKDSESSRLCPNTAFIPLESSLWLLFVLFGVLWAVLKLISLIPISFGFRNRAGWRRWCAKLHSSLFLQESLVFCSSSKSNLFPFISVFQSVIIVFRSQSHYVTECTLLKVANPMARDEPVLFPFCFKVKNAQWRRYLHLFSWTQPWNKLLHIYEVQMGLLASKGP